MIDVAESANNLGPVLVTIAETIESRIDRMLATAVRLIEPLLLGLIAVVVLFVALGLILPMCASVFDPTAPLEGRVFAVVGVRDVIVGRRLPGTLRVRIRESEPVALSPDDGRLVLIDERGWVLPFDPTRSPADLPLAPADPEVAALLARVRQADPALYSSIVSGATREDHVVLETADRRILLRADASAEVILDMMAVAQELIDRGQSYRELDGRFAGRVYVRGMGT
jgi:hypothetical protein